MTKSMAGFISALVVLFSPILLIFLLIPIGLLSNVLLLPIASLAGIFILIVFIYSIVSCIRGISQKDKHRGFAVAGLLINAILLFFILPVIALVTVGVTSAVPPIGASEAPSANHMFWATSQIAISHAEFGDGVQDSLQIRNNRPTTIIITGVYLDDNLISDGTWTDRTLNPGTPWTFRQTSSGNQDFILANMFSCPTGSSYAVAVRIEYTDPTTGNSHQFPPQGMTTFDGTCR
ncbi:MAG: hypothetical protein ACMXYF_04900 [Candidatus Woesearchaeota archaeon]